MDSPICLRCRKLMICLPNTREINRENRTAMAALKEMKWKSPAPGNAIAWSKYVNKW